MSTQDSMVQLTLNREEMAECIKTTVEQGQELSLLVTGYSMSPTLKHLKDRVVLVSPKGCTVKKLDMILFRRPDGKYVLHRILKCRPDGVFIVNGDAQLWTEEVQKKQILAVVKKIVKNKKTIDCQSTDYRIYAVIWTGLKPLRGILIGMYRLVQRIKHRRNEEKHESKIL